MVKRGGCCLNWQFKVVIGWAMLLPSLGWAQAPAASTGVKKVTPEEILLWPAGAPGAKGKTKRDQPRMFRYPAPVKSAVGTTILVCPGGGYGGLATGHEGVDIARFLNRLGVTAYVLHYRLGSHGYGHPIPLGDAQRALRMVRMRAEQDGSECRSNWCHGFFGRRPFGFDGRYTV